MGTDKPRAISVIDLDEARRLNARLDAVETALAAIAREQADLRRVVERNALLCHTRIEAAASAATSSPMPESDDEPARRLYDAIASLHLDHAAETEDLREQLADLDTRLYGIGTLFQAATSRGRHPSAPMP